MEEKISRFLAAAQTLANACRHLTTVTSTTHSDLPYLAARVERDSNGAVLKLRQVFGVGMLIPEGEYDPFSTSPTILM